MFSFFSLFAAVATGCPQKGYVTFTGYKAVDINKASVKFDSFEEYQSDVEGSSIGEACYRACITSKSACDYFQFSSTGSCLGFKSDDDGTLSWRDDGDELTSVGVPCE